MFLLHLLHFLLDLARPLGASWTTLAVSANVKEQQWHQGLFRITKFPHPVTQSEVINPWSLVSTIQFFRSLPRNLVTIGPGTHGGTGEKNTELEVTHKIGGQGTRCSSPTLSDTPELLLLGSQEPVNGAAHPGENNVLRNVRGCLSATLVWNICIFSFKEMQIYAAKVLQKNLIRSSTSARQVSKGSLWCMY